jgi:hypothetical protein
MDSITLNRAELGRIEKMFAGLRYREISVHQEVDCDGLSFMCPPCNKRLANEKVVVLKLADVEALIVEVDAASQEFVKLPDNFNPPYFSEL